MHEVRLPYFTLQLGREKEIIATGGGYYDLSNQQFLQHVAQDALRSHEPVGVLEEYGLRYCRVVTPGNQLLVFADMTSEQAALQNLVRSCVLVGVVSFLTFLGLDSRREEHVTVRGNQVELRQVVDILLDNARKYSNPGGKTVVELRREGRRKCVLSVANPGPEIPPEDLAHIFQRFYRIDRARTRTGSFGLGLAIAQSIVLRHRGRIWAQSRQGVNTFSAELPIT